MEKLLLKLNWYEILMCGFFFGLFGILLIITIIDKLSIKRNKWICRIMGWHKQPLNGGFDGCSFNGTCPRCGNEVLLDSQGNWF